MNLVLLLSIILVTQLPLNTFGKSSMKIVDANTEVPFQRLVLDQNEEKSIKTKKNDDEMRTKRNSMFNDADDDDDDDILINKLSREYVTSNLLDSTSSVCNK